MMCTAFNYQIDPLTMLEPQHPSIDGRFRDT